MDGTATRDRILHITDLHFWHVPRDPRRWVGKRAAGLVNVLRRRRWEYLTAQSPDFTRALLRQSAGAMLATGDFSSTALEEEFAQAFRFLEGLRQGGLDVFAIPGNHDVYTRRSFWQGRCRHMLEAFQPGPALPCRTLLSGGTPVVFAPTVCPSLLSRGYISRADAAETARLVREAPPGPVIVAAHYPVLHATPSYTSAFPRRLGNAACLRHALGETGRQLLYLSGHVHKFSYICDPLYPHMRHLCTPALFLHRASADGAFTQIDVAENGFHVTAHTLRDGAWTQETPQPGR